MFLDTEMLQCRVDGAVVMMLLRRVELAQRVFLGVIHGLVGPAVEFLGELVLRGFQEGRVGQQVEPRGRHHLRRIVGTGCLDSS